jgi:hypothetical protein
MTCSPKDTIETISETPALLFAGVKTPLGMLLYLFFLFLSTMGLKQLTGKNISSIFKQRLQNINKISRQQINLRTQQTTDNYKNSYKVLFFVIAVVTFVLTFFFATGDILWIAILFSIIIVTLGVSSFLNYLNNDSEVRSRLISTIRGGVIIGVGLSIIILLLKWGSEWFTGDVLIDFFFMFTILYTVIGSFALIPIGQKKVVKLFRKEKNKI